MKNDIFENIAANSSTIITDIPVSEVRMAAYQKPIDEKRCHRIVNTFDPHRMRPIDLSYRDDKFWCFDGQHRTRVYAKLGRRTIPAIVHFGLTYEQEAWLFAHQQDEVGSINANHKWVALIEARDDETLALNRVCKMWGFNVLAKNNKGNNIKCVSSIQKMYREFGPQKFGTILLVIKTAWNYLPHSTDAAIINGIALLMRTYKDKFDYNRLTSVLSKTTPKLILRDMEDKHHGARGEARRAAFQILDLYNNRLKKNALNSEALK